MTQQPPDSPLNLDSPSQYNGQSSIDGEYLVGTLGPGIDVGDSGDCLTHLDGDEFIGASEDILYGEPLPSTSSPPLPQEWQPSTLNPHYLTPGTGHCGSVFLGFTPPRSGGSEAATPSAISTSDHANSPSESSADYAATRRVPKPFVASPSVVVASTNRRTNKSGKLYWCTEFPPCNASLTSRHNLRSTLS
ncbi:hypothetical protein VNI00_013605 [Paramarasmius palmivorus]|uniref:Uncharacterized protein n=1 Tax=Paramarasmius palmivorus TaxID=297713 RepID=A0AAW0BW83_9AGAR